MASVITRAGLWVLHEPFVLAKTSREFAEAAQSFDLAVSPHRDNVDSFGLPVEVKSLNLTFHNPSDYPHATVLICSQSNFLKKWPGRDTTGRDFLFVSRETGAILWVPKDTQVTFGNETYDRSRNELYKTVTVNKSELKTLNEFTEMVHVWK